MTILDKYLKELFWKKEPKLPEFVDPNDPFLPNPYNFRQLKLDPKISKDDIRKADTSWVPMVMKGWETSESREKGFMDVVDSAKRWGHEAKLFTIVDKGKRVGIVGFTAGFYNIEKRPAAFLIYVTWVNGKNYATAGCMKLLNMHHIPQFGTEGNKINFFNINIEIHKDNISSIKVAENLKAELNFIFKEVNNYSLHPPYWWNNYKLLKH